MVRRDVMIVSGPSGTGTVIARCTSPAGASPDVSKGDLGARAGRQKPARRAESRSGERAHGPQHQVKPAASTDLQPGGRADHVTAKATLIAGVPKPAIGS